MSELISGKEALIALANGEEVELNSLTNGGWVDAQPWAVEYFITDNYEFRIKPRTITINGIEVPAPFKPESGSDKFYYIDSTVEKGYSFKGWESSYNKVLASFGAWRTEKEIKQVIAALRKVLGGGQ